RLPARERNPELQLGGCDVRLASHLARERLGVGLVFVVSIRRERFGARGEIDGKAKVGAWVRPERRAREHDAQALQARIARCGKEPVANFHKALAEGLVRAADGAHLLDVFANNDTAQLLVIAGELDIDAAGPIKETLNRSIEPGRHLSG